MTALSPELKTWIAENLINGCSTQQLVEGLARINVPEDVAVREIAEAQGHPYMKAVQAKKETKAQNSKATIFVSIAAYRDPELYPTVRDLFEKAKYPDNIHVGVCWQYNPLSEEPFILSDRRRQISVINVDYKKAQGLCWARHLVQKLYSNEEYYLQIDSHSRFVPHWDEQMIEELSRCPSQKPILSTYPNPYTLPNNLQDYGPYKLVFNKFFEKIPTFDSRPCTEEEKKTPSLSPIVSGGFVFCPSTTILEVPYDPYIYFIGDEISMSVRYWTHGYDIFTPTKTLMFHLYASPEVDKNLHWKDHSDWQTKYSASSRARLLHLLDVEKTTDALALNEIKRYGLGPYGQGDARSLSQYEKFAEVDFKAQAYSENARKGIPSRGY